MRNAVAGEMMKWLHIINHLSGLSFTDVWPLSDHQINALKRYQRIAYSDKLRKNCQGQYGKKTKENVVRVLAQKGLGIASPTEEKTLL